MQASYTEKFSPKFTPSSNGGLVSGYIDYADHRKARRIYFRENGAQVWVYTSTLDENDIVMAAKALQWCVTNLMTYDASRINVCKTIFSRFREGGILLFLSTPVDVPAALVDALARSPVFPVHVLALRNDDTDDTDSLTADLFLRRVKSLPLKVPTASVVETMYDLGRPPPSMAIRVGVETMTELHRSYSQSECKSEWRCQLPYSINNHNTVIVVVFDGFEFIELLTHTPVQADASLDTVQYVLAQGAPQQKPKKASEKMRMKRLKR